MAGNIRVDVWRGGEPLAAYAYWVWAGLDVRVQRACLFDVPLEKRAETLAAAWLKASHIGIAYAGDTPVAWGWTLPFAGRTGSCHFILDSKVHALAATRAFIEHISHAYASLLCLVPAHYRGTREVLEQAGFAQIARLPQSVNIDLFRHLSAGILYLWQGGDNE